MKPTISRLLAHHARFRPDHLALVCGGREYTFAQLHRAVSRLANAWRDNGLGHGDKVATVLPNGFELIAAYWAAATSGVVIVPCSTLLRGGGLKTLLRDSDSKAVIAHRAHADEIDSIRADLDGIARERFILVDDDGDGDGDNDSTDGWTTYANFIADASETDPRTQINGDDAYNIMYSSGTTGAPKGIVHSHYTRAMYCALFANAWRMTPESVVLHAGALVFNGAMLGLMPWMYLGCRYILQRRFDAEAFIAEVAARRATHALLVPTQVVAVLDSPAFAPRKLESLQMLCSLGAPLHLTHKQRLNDALPGRFHELYGVTEGFMTILDKTDATRKAGSVGTPAAFTQACILDDDDRPCAANVIGEICGRGPLLMRGYHNQPEQTARAMRNGWLHSGDLGYLDDDGFLFLVDRKKDMIVSGGANVYPKDIEEVVSRHPQVTEAAVFGVPDSKWGEAPVAAVTCRGALSADALIAWVNQRVDAKYQRIADAVVLKQFPRNVAGKVLKRTLREEYGARACLCCEKGIPKERPRVCPVCRHQFQGNGWDGIDAHWRAKHEKDVMQYEDFWNALCSAHKS
ncbi:MAG: class I adenylate-forming enzyme family protein [bacterium]